MVLKTNLEPVVWFERCLLSLLFSIRPGPETPSPEPPAPQGITLQLVNTIIDIQAEEELAQVEACVTNLREWIPR